MNVHEMIRETEQGEDVLLQCPEVDCGRRIVFRKPNDLIVIDQGDFYALHRYASDPMAMDTSILRPLSER